MGPPLPSEPHERVRVGELPIDVLTFDEALRAIERLIDARRGGAVYTPNVDHVVLFNEDSQVRQAYLAASLSLVDGTPVLWAARLLGRRLPEKVSGSDLVMPLVRRAAERGFRVYLLGGGEGIVERVRRRMEQEAPGVCIVGESSPHIDLTKPPSSRAEVVEAVRGTSPDLVFVALGTPKQELWIHEVRHALEPAVLIGVGASFDFLTGAAKRAPAWVSAAGFEWLYRLLMEPRRLWRRYLLRDPKFAAILLRDLWARRAGR